jgi:hypothetical protein
MPVSAKQLIIMSENDPDFYDLVDHVLIDQEGYTGEDRPSCMSTEKLCKTMFSMGIAVDTVWSLSEIDKDLLVTMLGVIEEEWEEVPISDVIKDYVSIMLESERWHDPLD